MTCLPELLLMLPLRRCLLLQLLMLLLGYLLLLLGYLLLLLLLPALLHMVHSRRSTWDSRSSRCRRLGLSLRHLASTTITVL